MRVYTHGLILPATQQGIASVMKGINGSIHRRPVSPGVGDFWRPPAAVRAAIARGDRKVREGMAS